jgi:ubiquinone/menaquinone biosynthesis C-methylase UbiE
MSNSLKKWKKLYASDQEALYNNFIIRAIFDIGHHYIAKRGRHIKGSILDIGSGVGYHLKFETINKRRKYICLDSDKKKLGKITNKNVRKLHASCENIPLTSKTVDLVIASHVLEHVKDLESCLNEIKRVLKANGKLLVVLPCDPGYFWTLLTRFSPSRHRLKMQGIDYEEVMRHEHVNSFGYCKSMLTEKFSLLEETYFPTPIKNFNFNITAHMYFINSKK